MILITYGMNFHAVVVYGIESTITFDILLLTYTLIWYCTELNFDTLGPKGKVNFLH